MKKMIFALALLAISVETMALSRVKVREYARFLSDRMAYVLDLSSGQYDDCYEINYDFVNAVGDLLDDMEAGYSDAYDDYYQYLDYRNEDLSYVLSSYQYSRFVSTECFYRPFCIYDGSWAFRPYMVYTNRYYFYRSAPLGYNGYYGAHARRYYSAGFYIGRYSGPRYDFVSIRRHHDFDTFRRRDFGPVISGHGGHGGPAYRPQPRPSAPKAGPGGSQRRPDAGRVNPGRSQDRPNGGRVNNDRPQDRRNDSKVNPGNSNNRPGGFDVNRGRSNDRRNDPGVSSGNSKDRRNDSKVSPSSSNNRPGGFDVNRGRSNDRSNDSGVSNSRSQSGSSSPEVKQGQQRNDSRQGGGGGGVVRRGRG
jgi:hypothetical protein